MTTDNIPPRLANAVFPAVLLESDLKPGLIVKAKWNGENATIIKVECLIGELNKNFKRKRTVEILSLNIYI